MGANRRERGESEGRGEGVKEERRGGGGRKEGRKRKGERERGGKREEGEEGETRVTKCKSCQNEISALQDKGKLLSSCLLERIMFVTRGQSTSLQLRATHKIKRVKMTQEFLQTQGYY